MTEIPLATLGPLVSAFLQAFKAIGIPAKYVPVLNLFMALGIALWASWGSIESSGLLIDWGTLALATAGTYDLIGQVKKS